MKGKLNQILLFIGQKRNQIQQNRFLSDNRGFGMNELLGIAAALIIAAFIIIPSLRTFAQGLMSGLGDWWDDVISNRIFPTT